jgi:hypothetical protein
VNTNPFDGKETQQNRTPESRIAEAVADRVVEPVDEFRTQIEGIQNLIPERILRGLQGALSQMQNDVQGMVDQKLRAFFSEYNEHLLSQKKKIQLKLWGHVMLGFMIFFVGALGVTWHMLPSLEEIKKEKDILKSLKNAEWETPEEYYDKESGRLYVRVRPGTEFAHKGKDGATKTFAEIVSP